MKKLLLPIILALVGVGGGIGAGIALGAGATADTMAGADTCLPGDPSAHDTAEPPPVGSPEAHAEASADRSTEAGAAEGAKYEYAKLNNQFVVPVVHDGKVQSMVVLSLSIEVATGKTTDIFAAEPKLRDVFLQVLFDHANIGGFDGDFTRSDNMRILRGALKTAGQRAMGDLVNDVLIMDILRQDV